MKLIGGILFLIGVIVIIEAKPKKLLNGGSLLAPNGKYIPGKFAFSFLLVQSLTLGIFPHLSGIILRIWDKPLLERLKHRSKKCAIGYVEMMQNLAPETDLALTTNNGNSLRLLFKVYGYLYQMQIPFTHNRRLREAFVQAVEGNKREEARLLNNNNRINYPKVNEFFVIAANSLNDILN